MDNSENKKLSEIINQCSAIARRAMRDIEDECERMGKRMDLIIAEDTKIALDDVQQSQYDQRKILWELYEKDYNLFKEFIFHLRKFAGILKKREQEDFDNFLKNLQAGTLSNYYFKKDEGKR